MSAFITLIRREILDHKGAMVYTPLIVAALLAVFAVSGTISLWNNPNYVQVDPARLGQAAQTSTPFTPPIAPQAASGDTTTATTKTLADSSVEKKTETRSSNGDIESTTTTIAPGGKTETRIVVKSSEGDTSTTIIKTTPDGKTSSTTTETNSDGESKNNTDFNVGIQGDGTNIHLNGMGGKNLADMAQALKTLPVGQRIDGTRFIGAGLFTIGIIVVFISLFTIPFILLSSLYDERQDRSILFWKSLPVSDTATVLSKLVSASFVTIGFAFGLAIIVHIIYLVALSILAGHFGIPDVGEAWYLPTIFTMWLDWLLLLIEYVLMALPIYAWFLLASAWSGSKPILLGIVGPMAAALLEFILLHSHYIGDQFGWRLGYNLGDQFKSLNVSSYNGLSSKLFSDALGKILEGYLRPDLWIGIVVAAGLIYASIEVRRRKAL